MNKKNNVEEQNEHTPGSAELQSNLAQCHKEREEYLAGWQRCQADAMNARRREEEERALAARLTASDIVETIIPVLTTFQHAFSGNSDNQYTKGFRHIYDQLRSALEQHGVHAIRSEEGMLFDASCHEAVGTVLVAQEEDENKIMETVEDGYALNGKVLKPAKVKIGEYT
jgi:molecular chaperone GrpE